MTISTSHATPDARATLLSSVGAIGQDNNQGITILGLGDTSAAPLTSPTMRLARVLVQQARGTVKPADAGEVYTAFLAGRAVSAASQAAGTSKVKIQIEFAQIPHACDVWNAFVRKVEGSNKPMTGVYEAWLSVVRKAAGMVIADPATDGGATCDEIVTAATAKPVKTDDDNDSASIAAMVKKLTAMAASRASQRDKLLSCIATLNAVSQHILSGQVERPDATPDTRKAEADIQAAQPKRPPVAEDYLNTQAA